VKMAISAPNGFMAKAPIRRECNDINELSKNVPERDFFQKSWNANKAGTLMR